MKVVVFKRKSNSSMLLLLENVLLKCGNQCFVEFLIKIVFFKFKQYYFLETKRILNEILNFLMQLWTRIYFWIVFFSVQVSNTLPLFSLFSRIFDTTYIRQGCFLIKVICLVDCCSRSCICYVIIFLRTPFIFTRKQWKVYWIVICLH